MASIAAQQHLITPAPSPTPLVFARQDGTSSQSFSYPGCASDADGPCQLGSSSQDACSREFPDSDMFFQQYYCMCTNGYYDRSSECWNDCYGYRATSVNSVSISRQARLVSLECESYSLAIESQAEANSALSDLFSSISADESIELASATTESRVNFSPGAPADEIVPETMTWADRPEPTGVAQQTGGAPTVRCARSNALLLVTVVLSLASVVLS